MFNSGKQEPQGEWPRVSQLVIGCGKAGAGAASPPAPLPRLAARRGLGRPRLGGRAPPLPLSAAIADVFIPLINELCKLTSTLLHNCY